ncbi:MAG: superoxide dismutase family protein [Ruminococcus sp.]|nr:superoxide dismutase family protein [Ruminococcus sp.]
MMQCNRRPNAKAFIQGSEQFPELRGEVLFYQERDGALISARVRGLPKNETGFYGFHIHEGDSCNGKGFPDAKGHYNPKDHPHPSHAGDLPPLLSNHGNAYLSVKTDRFRLRDIIGRTVIIHGGTDDFRTQPSGDAGEKIACGVIKAV